MTSFFNCTRKSNIVAMVAPSLGIAVNKQAMETAVAEIEKLVSGYARLDENNHIILEMTPLDVRRDDMSVLLPLDVTGHFLVVESNKRVVVCTTAEFHRDYEITI